jgi:hypothetical protein
VFFPSTALHKAPGTLNVAEGQFARAIFFAQAALKRDGSNAIPDILPNEYAGAPPKKSGHYDVYAMSICNALC